MTVEMTVGDIVRALELNDDGKQYEAIREACRGLRSHVLELDTPDGWVIFGWVDKARYIKSRDVLQLRISDELKPYVHQLQKAFSVLTIADIARLQGKYALRIFELVMSTRGMAGTGGNKPGQWFYDAQFDELRTMFRIAPHEYKVTGNFRNRVIDDPVREINEADLGIRIECDYEHFRHGRRLLGVRLKCKLLKDAVRNVTPATKGEETIELLKQKHPSQWEEYLSEERKQPPMFGDAEAWAIKKAESRLEEFAAKRPKK
jgi:plasmid replication initiation protein